MLVGISLVPSQNHHKSEENLKGFMITAHTLDDPLFLWKFLWYNQWIISIAAWYFTSAQTIHFFNFLRYYLLQ